jgi:hypothetical protein
MASVGGGGVVGDAAGAPQAARTTDSRTSILSNENHLCDIVNSFSFFAL